MDKSSVKPKLLTAGAFAVTALVKILITACKNSIIIYTGVKTFSVLSILSIAAVVVSGLAFAVVLAAGFKKHAESDKAGSKPLPDDSINAEKLRGQLAEFADPYNEWAGIMGAELKCLQEQLGKMDICQEKLHRLLENNQAESLADMEEIVNDVEQHMFRNVRKSLNCLQIGDSSDQKSRDRAVESVKTCIRENASYLGQIQELMSAAADFLNSQDNDQSALDVLEAYKDMIRNSVRSEKLSDKYIKQSKNKGP